jgi:Tetratricopeptide repeat
MSPGQDERHELGQFHDYWLSEVLLSSGRSGERRDRYAVAELQCRQELSNHAVASPQDNDRLNCTRVKLAIILRIQGAFPEAEALHQLVLYDILESHGEAHKFALASMSNLAVVLRYQQKCTEAEILQRRAYEGSIELFGP